MYTQPFASFENVYVTENIDGCYIIIIISIEIIFRIE